MTEPAPIVFRHYPLCLAPLRAPARLGGQKIRCPECKALVTVPLSTDQREAERLSKDAARRERDAQDRADAAERDALRVRREAEADAAAIRANAAPVAPAAPQGHSPLAWGFGIGCGWILAGLVATLVFWGSCFGAIGAAVK